MPFDFSLASELISFVGAVMRSPMFWDIWFACASVNLLLMYPASLTWYQLHDRRRTWSSDDVEDELVRRAEMWKMMAFYVRGREGRYVSPSQVVRTVLLYVAPATAPVALALTLLAMLRDLLESLRRRLVAMPGARS